MGPINNSNASSTPKTNYHHMVQTFLAKIVLEVFGGGGAIWGFSEVITFRNPSTQEVWS